MSIIVILNFAVDDDDYIYFSVQRCTVMKPFCFIVGFHFYGYAVCVLHVVLKHFRENKRSLSPFFLFKIRLIPLLLFPADILWALLILSP